MFESPPDQTDIFMDRAHNAVWESLMILRRFAESERNHAHMMRRHWGKDESACRAEEYATRVERFCDVAEAGER